MRYQLFDDQHDGEGEVKAGKQKNTKAEIEQWITDNARAHGGINWRSGYTVRFKNADYTYTWRKISDNSIVKV